MRDALLGRRHNDLDFTTVARPDEIERLLVGWADATWDIGTRVRHHRQPQGRVPGRDHDVPLRGVRPHVAQAGRSTYGDSLEGDLARRDFTVNAMAVRLPSREFVDPYGGLVDLAHGLIRTPGRPEDSFSDDPLRMMRAARFAAQLGFTSTPRSWPR